jgi:hypothetical protein
MLVIEGWRKEAIKANREIGRVVLLDLFETAAGR